MEKLGQYHRMATVIGYGMIGTLLIFTAVVETLKGMNYETRGFFPSSTLDVLRCLLLGITLVEFFAIRIVKKMILSGGGRISALSNQGDPLLSKVQKLFTAAIVTFAFCESAAIYGLVLFIIGGNSFDFYLFIFLSLVLFAVYFPKYPQWEEWVNSTG
jgi:F0F1-type ATP synthase membrane subunit c/vacuolar-type H+-ATPase subunit K